MTREQKSPEEYIEYFQDMLVSPEGQPDLVYLLGPKELESIRDYINESRTASSVPEQKAEYNPETITSELVYYWLVGLRIPFHPVETWHLSRLMMLIQITSFKQAPPKKQKSADVMKDWARINEERLKKFGTTG